MRTNEPLTPELSAVRDELMAYHTARLHDFQTAQERRRTAKNADGTYSVSRALRALAEDRLASEAPYEKMVSDRLAEDLGRAPRPGYCFVPVGHVERRDLSASVAGAGGFLVETVARPFTGAVLANSVAFRLGLPTLPLTASTQAPRVSGTATGYWLASEGATITESGMTFGVGAALPKSLGLYVQASRQFLTQTGPAGQEFIMRELGRAAAATLDGAIFSGSGASGQPRGLFQSGLSSVSGTSLAWSGVTDIVKTVEDASGLIDPASTAFTIPPNVAKLLRTREKATGSGLILDDVRIGGYPALVSKSVPDSSLVFGDFSGLALCQWGALEIGTDPYGASSELFKSGLVAIRAIWSVDLLILRPASFVVCQSIT